MTEHEKLKAICDKIEYAPSFYGLKMLWKADVMHFEKMDLSKVDVREIIFTPEFMEKFDKYYRLEINGPMGFGLLAEILLKHLDNPVEYLYTLIK